MGGFSCGFQHLLLFTFRCRQYRSSLAPRFSDDRRPLGFRLLQTLPRSLMRDEINGIDYSWTVIARLNKAWKFGAEE